MATVELSAKAGESGKLFGAITTKRLSEEIKAKTEYKPPILMRKRTSATDKDGRITHIHTSKLSTHEHTHTHGQMFRCLDKIWKG